MLTDTGRFYEDFTVGDVYEHALGRTITETDNTWFTLLTQNTAPIHFDHHYATQTEFGQPLVVSTLIVALVTGQSVTDVSRNVFANVAWDKVRLTKPVFIGDTIYSSSKVLSMRPSRSRPMLGIVEVESEGHNHRGETVVTFERTFLVYRRGHGPAAALMATRAEGVASA